MCNMSYQMPYCCGKLQSSNYCPDCGANLKFGGSLSPIICGHIASGQIGSLLPSGAVGCGSISPIYIRSGYSTVGGGVYGSGLIHSGGCVITSKDSPPSISIENRKDPFYTSIRGW